MPVERNGLDAKTRQDVLMSTRQGEWFRFVDNLHELQRDACR